MRVRLDHVLSELILEQSSLSREFPPWNDPSWSCRRNRPHHLQEGCRAVQHVSPHHCFQETSGRFSPFLAAKTLDCRFKQDTWPTVTRGFCADAKTEDELGVLTTRLETEPKETKFVTYRNKSVGCWRCSVDMCVFVFCIPTGYITLNWQWQNLKYQNTVD